MYLLAVCVSLLAVEPKAGYLADKISVSGTGLFACQLAKHVFHAGKVISSVSTSKIPKVNELLGEGTVDESKTNPTPFEPSSIDK